MVRVTSNTALSSVLIPPGTSWRHKGTVLENYDNWEKLSKPRNLAYSSGKVYVTDRGLHKVNELAFAFEES